MDECCHSWDNLAAVWGHAKSVVVSGLSCAVSEGSLALVDVAVPLLSPFMLLVFIIFCSNGISYELCAKAFCLGFFRSGIT